MGQPDNPRTAWLLRAQDLSFRHGDHRVLGPLNFSVGPGLTWACGGDGRGKTTLLRLLAGRLAPTAGSLSGQVSTTFDHETTDPALNQTDVQSWLAGLQDRYPQWDPAVQTRLAAAWALSDHLPKPFYMLSAGSRRKAGLLAAAASGAELTLLDTPFAALDAASGRVLVQVLADARQSQTRAWVVADAQRPPELPGGSPMTFIDLGD